RVAAARIGALDLLDHPRVNALDVAQEPLGVRAQRSAHLTKVLDQLHALGLDLAGGRARVLEQLAGPVTGLARRLLGALLGPGDDLERLAGGAGACLL